MSTFPLKIVTPEGLVYKGEARQVTVRTLYGDLTVLPRHMNFVSALGNGSAIVAEADGSRRARCTGGIFSVHNGAVTIISSHFQWR